MQAFLVAESEGRPSLKLFIAGTFAEKPRPSTVEAVSAPAPTVAAAAMEATDPVAAPKPAAADAVNASSADSMVARFKAFCEEQLIACLGAVSVSPDAEASVRAKVQAIQEFVGSTAAGLGDSEPALNVLSELCARQQAEVLAALSDLCTPQDGEAEAPVEGEAAEPETSDAAALTESDLRTLWQTVQPYLVNPAVWFSLPQLSQHPDVLALLQEAKRHACNGSRNSLECARALIQHPKLQAALIAILRACPCLHAPISAVVQLLARVGAPHHEVQAALNAAGSSGAVPADRTCGMGSVPPGFGLEALFSAFVQPPVRTEVPLPPRERAPAPAASTVMSLAEQLLSKLQCDDTVPASAAAGAGEPSEEEDSDADDDDAATAAAFLSQVRQYLPANVEAYASVDQPGQQSAAMREAEAAAAEDDENSTTVEIALTHEDLKRWQDATAAGDKRSLVEFITSTSSHRFNAAAAPAAAPEETPAPAPAPAPAGEWVNPFLAHRTNPFTQHAGTNPWAQWWCPPQAVQQTSAGTVTSTTTAAVIAGQPSSPDEEKTQLHMAIAASLDPSCSASIASSTSGQASTDTRSVSPTTVAVATASVRVGDEEWQDVSVTRVASNVDAASAFSGAHTTATTITTPSPCFAESAPAVRQSSSPLALRARLVSSADGTSRTVRPFEPIQKTWELLNDGAEAWPASVRMVNVGGELMGAPATGVAVRAAQPGETVTVTMQMRAPTIAGRHASYWRLCTADGMRFGARIWVDVTVEADPTPVSAELPAAAPVTPIAVPEAIPVTSQSSESQPVASPLPADYEVQLAQLASMGFVDAPRNVALLREHNSNLATVVECLLSDA